MSENYAKYQFDRSFWREPIPLGNLSLVQIGRLYLNEGGSVAEHTHLNWFELTVATDGEGEVFTNGRGVPVERGDVILSYPGDFHAISTGKVKPLKFDYIAFWTEDPILSARLFDVTGRYPAAEARLFRDARIGGLLSDALAEIDGEDVFSRETVGTALKYIVLRILKDFGEGAAGAERNTDKKQLCHQMMIYVDSHIFSMKNLCECAQALNYRYGYLSEIFRETTGDTLAHYYRDRRLEAGRLLLSEGKMTVSEVAEKLGYASVYSFSRSYKSLFSVCPTGHSRRKTADPGLSE